MNKTQKQITDELLLQITFAASKNEKLATLELLQYLAQVDERRAYATLSCSSLFDYVVCILGYSESQASERVNSVRLMRAHPEVKEKIKNGNLSMTTASQIERFKKQEKKAGTPINQTKTLELIETCAGLSKREVEKTLFALSSQEAKLAQENIKVVSSHLTEVKFNISESTFQKLNEVKNLIGNESLSTIFDQALDALLEAKRKKKGIIKPNILKVTAHQVNQGENEAAMATTEIPKDRATLPAMSNPRNHSRFISIHSKRAISLRSLNQCEFVDPKNDMRCNSKFKLELDHVFPFALGGTNEADNLQHLCKQHNLKAAEAWGLLKQ